ncbi:MAG TPA: NAD-dependent epimerase/dehydratase family protein [Vicinamibacterales bacterium]|nr:NAD-dependent epimerase/dehydratase family protein [Vicinamibacterales bacterium]
MTQSIVRVLVIGGTGFIGSHLVRGLIRLGHDVTVFHRGRTGVHPAPPLNTDPGGRPREIFGDRRRLAESAASFRAVRPDVVIDVILSSGSQARELVSVCRGLTPRILALSSMDVYRACGITHGLEEGPLEPMPLTEASALRTKLQTYPPAQVQMLQQIFGWLDSEYDKIPVEREVLGDPDVSGTVLRLPMVYGPGDPLHRFYPVVKRVLDGRRVIPFSAAMAQWRGTKGYVENVAAAIALAAVSDRAAGQIYNVGDPDTPTELEWAKRVADALEWNGEFKVMTDGALPPELRAPGNAAQHWVADTTKIRRELGFTEVVPREQAIRATVEWERTNPPTGFTPHRFDYDAEDATLRGEAS